MIGAVTFGQDGPSFGEALATDALGRFVEQPAALGAEEAQLNGFGTADGVRGAGGHEDQYELAV